MKLTEIKIFNYRKFINETLTLSEHVTLLAGANNSGKTSLVNLINSIMQGKQTQFSISDIPIKLTKEWVDNAYEKFMYSFENNTDKLDIINAIVSELFDLNDKASKLLIPSTSIKFRVDYDEKDDLRNFADYIMDLDLNHMSIYFEYDFKPTPISFGKTLEDFYKKLKSRFDKIKTTQNNDLAINQFKEIMLKVYEESIREGSYYCDQNFKHREELDTNIFRRLFNFKYILAGRSLDDHSNGNFKTLSKSIVELASQSESLVDLISDLPDKILLPIKETNIIQEVRNESVKELTATIEAINKVSNSNTGTMILDIDITEETIKSLLNDITKTKYEYENFTLSEASQGLGYSNMIFILLQIEAYKKTIDSLCVNFFIVEEPESHMHPQMQRIFGKYLREYYMESNIQGIITTHSAEMVRLTKMNNLRVLRSVSQFTSKVYDFSVFKAGIELKDKIENSHDNDIVLATFYDWFYEIGFSDIVFADRVILYEGDTERLLIRKLLTVPQFEELSQKYIAYVQVGGAYAHKYSEIIDFLRIKTLVLADIDYKKDATTVEEIEISDITNATIKYFYKLVHGKDSPKVNELYDFIKNQENTVLEDILYLSFQNKEEMYSRTLEEAMLSKFYKMLAIEKKDRAFWVNSRKENMLKFTIPKPSSETDVVEEYTIRDIVKHTENRKTDFMYSVILNGHLEKMLPNYIEEGLKWLQK